MKRGHFNWFRDALRDRGTKPCIPGRRSRDQPIKHDRRRHRIEMMFGRLKDWRRVATRYDRGPIVFLKAIALAATVMFWLRALSIGRGGGSGSSGIGDLNPCSHLRRPAMGYPAPLAPARVGSSPCSPRHVPLLRLRVAAVPTQAAPLRGQGLRLCHPARRQLREQGSGARPTCGGAHLSFCIVMALF